MSKKNNKLSPEKKKKISHKKKELSPRMTVLMDQQLWKLLLLPALIAAAVAFFIYKKTNSTPAVSVVLLGIAVALHVRFLDSRANRLPVNATLSLVGVIACLVLAAFNLLIKPLSSF